MARPKCTPLEITCILTDGTFVSPDGIVMFDSILYHAWFAVHMPDVLTGERDISDNPPRVGLPLRQLPENRWAASRAVYNTERIEVHNINRHPNFFDADMLGLLDMDKGLISDSVGKFRAYRIPLLVRTVKDRTLTFYAVGHADDVVKLLSRMHYIGKKSSAGFGMVECWNVREISDDYTLMHPKFGAMRPVPIGDTDTPIQGCMVHPYGIRPPYWKPVNQEVCYVPVC